MTAPTSTETDPVRFVAAVARPLILTRFDRASCIVSTAVACDFLSWAGMSVKPIEVEAMAWNAAAIEQIERGVTDWREWTGDAWSLGVVQNQESTHRHVYKPWSGAHLCALVRGDTLLDLSADQFDRPLYGIRVERPIVLPWDGEQTRAVAENGSVLMYKRPAKPDPSFRTAPDWRDRQRRADIVRELIRLARLVGVGS